MDSEKATELWNGLMEIFMKANGKTTNQMEKDSLNTKMEMFILVNGSMITLMAMENIFTRTELITQDNGSMINNVAKAKSNGRMVLYLQEIIMKEWKMEKENLNSQMAPHTKGNSKTMKFMEKEPTFGQIIEYTKEIGF